MERLQLREERRLAMGRRRRLASQPHEHVAVQFLHEALEFGQFILGEGGQVRVREFPEQNVHLPHATMPGAEQGAAAAGIEIDAGQGGFGHTDLHGRNLERKQQSPPTGIRGQDGSYIEVAQAVVRGNGALVPRPAPR